MLVQAYRQDAGLLLDGLWSLAAMSCVLEESPEEQEREQKEKQRQLLLKVWKGYILRRGSGDGGDGR